MSNKKAQLGETENIKFSFAPICKKAQIGETMTWVVATIIIIVTLIIFIYTSSLLAKANVNINIDSKWKGDLFEEKTSFAFEDSVVGDKNKKIIENWIEEVNNENE